MEMVGTDSTVFRVHIQAANQIAAFKLKGNSPPGLSLEEKKQYEQNVKEKIGLYLIVETFHSANI